jgi:penicillin-binding protein 1A
LQCLLYPENQLNPTATDTHRELQRLQNFSPYLPQAVVASEDSRYYWHLGVDPYGIARAVVTNLKSSELREGASTITQQLARSLFPEVGRQNTAGRKLREMLVALKLEAFYSKNVILIEFILVSGYMDLKMQPSFILINLQPI